MRFPSHPSYLRRDHLHEYWGNTVALLPDHADHPVYITGFDTEPDEGTQVTYLDREGDNNCIFIEEKTYDGMMKHLKPWFPPPFFAQVREGSSVLIHMNQESHYKRSADCKKYNVSEMVCDTKINRVRTRRNESNVNIQQVHLWTKEYPSIEDAVQKAIMNGGSVVAVSGEYAIACVHVYNKTTIVVLYYSTPIGYLTSNYELKLCPAYEKSFRSVRKIMEVA